MDYGRLIRDAWQLTWRYRFLWFFGIFAGSSGPSCNPGANVNVPFSGAAPRGGPDGDGAIVPPADIPAFFQDNAALIGALIVLGIALAIALIVLSVISQGALVGGAARLSRGEPTSFGIAWQLGLRTFWRFFGLNVAAIVAGFAVLGLFIPAGILIALGFSDATFVLIALGIVAGIVALLVAIPLWIAIGIVVTLAMRAVGVDGERFGSALRSGYQILRRRLGDSLIVWLIGLGLGIGGGIAVAFLWFIPAVPIGGLAIILLITLGPQAISLTVLGIAIVVLVVVGAVLAGILGSFLWNYWTLAYLQLRQGGPSVA